MTWARHVYHAGSRVGADRLGSARKRHPSDRPSAIAVSAIAHHVLRMLARAGSLGVRVSGTLTISPVAMPRVVPPYGVGPPPVREPPKDTRRTLLDRGSAQAMSFVFDASGRH